MVKLIVMNAADSQVIPAPPNLIRALLAGFDTIANHIYLILFSIGLDIILWFGPQLRLFQPFRAYLTWTTEVAQQQTPQMVGALQTGQDVLLSIAEKYNLLSALRSFPIGVPSLMAGRAPLANPLGKLANWDIQTFGMVALVWLAIVFLGMLVGTMYYSLTAQAAVTGKVSFKIALQNWPGRFFQVALLSIFWLVILFAISIPLSCVLPFLMAGGGSIGRVAIFIYGAILVWLLFPLVFSPFGIFIHQDKMWSSVMRGARIVRFTMPTTLLFALVIIVLSQGLDMLWNIPGDASWISLVGVIGHAFIAASLLASVFIYYRDAGVYVQERLEQTKS